MKASPGKESIHLKVTMDKQITKKVTMEIPHSYSLVDIRLYSKDYESGEIVPISMDAELIV